MRLVVHTKVIICSLFISIFFGIHLFADTCVEQKMALHRGFQHPDYTSTYGSVQLFSISDIGRSMFPVKKPASMVLSRPAEFEPECEANSSPMLKVRASGVSIDFNSFEIKKLIKSRHTDDYLSYAVGIEIGFSPAELAADPGLEQVQNVVIKNGGLSNFEIGIVVHAGVKNVLIEDFHVSRSPIGILFLGQEHKKISSCMLKQVRVTGDFEDDALMLQWAKVKIEENTVSSIDSENGGTTLLKGKAGNPAKGYGYGSDYCFMQLAHNPVTNMNDAYTYHGVYLKHCVNVMLENVFVKCIGYQGDRHEVVAPGATVGTVTNAANSQVSINGNSIAGEGTATIAKGISIVDCSSVFMKSCEAVQCVSALTAYGIFVKDSSSLSMQSVVTENNDAHHKTTGLAAQATTDADVKLDTQVQDVKTSETIFSLYTIFANDISALPITNSPIIDMTIAAARDAILHHKALIDGGIGLSAMMYHVSQIIKQAQAIIDRYNTIVLTGSTPTADDSDAHMQASAILKSGDTLQQQLLHSLYISGRACYGLFFDNVHVVDVQDIIANHNTAQNFVAGLYSHESDVFTGKVVACNHNVADDSGDTTAMPVAQGANAHAHGMVLQNADTVSLHDVTANFNESTGIAHGLYGYGVDSFKCSSLACTNNAAMHASLAQGWTTGVCFFNCHSSSFSSLNANANYAKLRAHGLHIACASSADISCVHADNNVSEDTEVVGAYLDRCHSLKVQHMSATSNNGELKAYGMLFNHCASVDGDGIAADDNFVNRDAAAATDCYGIWFNAPEGVYVKHVSASNNRGRTLGVGLYAKDTRTLHIEDGDFCVNSATECLDGEKDRCNDAANASKFFSKDYPSGALGMYFLDSCDVSLQRVTACKNFSHRAAGIFALSSSDFVITDSTTSFQSATGQYFINDPFNLQDTDVTNDRLFCEFPIPVTQYATIFGSPELENPAMPTEIIAANQVNLLQAVCCFFKSAALIPGTPGEDFSLKNVGICSLQDCDDPCEGGGTYNARKKFAISWLLIQAAMTKYRFFGGAVGLHLHDCDGFSVKNHFANGNTSVKDNAAGIACTGSNKSHVFHGTRSVNNDAWTESALGAVVSDCYDLSAVKPFYDALYATTGNVLTNDFDIGPGTQLIPKKTNFVTTFVDKKPIKYFKINIDCSCPGGSGISEDLWFTSPVGGLAIGVLLGDCAEHIEVGDFDCANNKGYSGGAFGLLQDVAANTHIDSNRLYQNFANILGICFGLADITIESTSIMMRNFMFCNRIGDFLNFNYFVPYDPTNAFGMYFPVRIGFNGDFNSLYKASQYDNIEIRFTHTAPVNPCVPDYIGSRDPSMADMKSCWEDQGFLGTTGTTITNEFQQCIENISTIASATGGLTTKFVNEIITAVLAHPTGAAAISAGRDAGVAAGLLEVIALSAASIADSNRMMALSKLQELVCEEIYRQLNNDPVLLVVQEVLSVLVPRKRSHIAGLNHEASRFAGVMAGVSGGNLLHNLAEGVATVASATLEHCPDKGGDPSVLSARDIFAMINALKTSALYVTSGDLVAGQEALANQGVAQNPDTDIQDSVERHVAIRLKRGLTESEAVAKAQDATRSYGTIVSEFRSNNTTLSSSGLSTALDVLDSFFDLKHESSLSGSPPQYISEAAAVRAATHAGMHVDNAGTNQEALIIGVLESVIRQAVQFRNPFKSTIEVDALVDPILVASKDVALASLKEVQSNTLLDTQRKELASMVGGLTTACLMLLKNISEAQAKSDGLIAAQDVAKLSSVSMSACNLIAHTIQMQIDLVGNNIKRSGYDQGFSRSLATEMFDYRRDNPANDFGLSRLWNCLSPQDYSVTYNSNLYYKDVAYGIGDNKYFVAGATEGMTGTDPGLFIFSESGILLKKFSFIGAEVVSLAAHPNRDWVAVGLSTGEVKLVDVSGYAIDTWMEHPTAALPVHTDKVETIRFSADGTRLATSGKDKIVKVYDTSNASPAAWTQLCASSIFFDFSAVMTGTIKSLSWKGNTLLAVADTDSSDIIILNVSDCTKSVFSLGSDDKVHSVAFNHDGTLLAAATDNADTTSADADIHVWNTSSADFGMWSSEKVFTVSMASLLQSLTFHPSLNYLAVADPQNATATANTARVRLYDLTSSMSASWVEVPTLSPITVATTTTGLSGIAFNSTGSQLVVTTNSSDVIFYDTSATDPMTWFEQKRLQKHADAVRAISCSPNGVFVATGSDDNTIKVWRKNVDKQELLATLGGAQEHTDSVTALAWSSDSRYLFSGSLDDTIKVWDLMTGTPVFVAVASLGADITSFAARTVSDKDYIVVGLADNTIEVVEFDRAAMPMLTSIVTITGHAAGITSVSLSADGTRLVSASTDAEVRYWDMSNTIPDGIAPTLLSTLNSTVLGSSNWHAGVINAVDISLDKNTIFSVGHQELFITDVTNAAMPSYVAVNTNFGGNVIVVQAHPDGTHLLTVSEDGVIKIFDVSSLPSITETRSLFSPLKFLGAGTWCHHGYDALFGGLYGFGVMHFESRFCVGIAQQVQDEISDQSRAVRKAKEMIQLAGFSEAESIIVAQATYDYLIVNSGDVSGAARIACSSFTTILTGRELCSLVIKQVKLLDHPVDEAVKLVEQKDNVDTTTATNSATMMYAYLKESPGDTTGAAAECLISNEICRAIAQVLNDYGNSEAEYLIKLAYPMVADPFATNVATAGSNYLSMNLGDVTGAAQVVCQQIIDEGQPIHQKFCIGLVQQVQNYLDFLGTFIGMSDVKPIELVSVGGSGKYYESFNMVSDIIDALKADPISSINQANADNACLQTSLVPCSPAPTETTIENVLTNYMNGLEPTVVVPIGLTKQLRRTLETCTITGVTISNPTDSVETSAIASALVGRMLAQKLNSVTLDMASMTITASMAHTLLNGGLLPCGTLKNMRGDALDQGAGNAVGGGRFSASDTGSVAMPLSGSYATLEAYLTALAADVTTQIIDVHVAYGGLNADEKVALARAMVLRTLLCGSEVATRELFDGTTNASYPADIATIVHEIVTTGLTPAIGLGSLSTATRQEIAATVLMFYGMTAGTVTFAPFASSTELQAIALGAYAGASAAGILNRSGFAPFFALFGGIGTCAGFMQDRALNPMVADQQSVFDFTQIGSELAAGFIRALDITDIGMSGQAGVALDLTEPVLASLAGGMLTEAVSVIEDQTSVNYGKAAVGLAYNQVYGDQLCKLIANIVRQSGSITFGEKVAQFAGLTSLQATAIAAKADVTAMTSIQQDHYAVCQEFIAQVGSAPTVQQWCTAMVQHAVDVLQNPGNVMLNINDFALFGDTGKGHPETVGIELAKDAGIINALAVIVGQQVYNHLIKNPFDTSGAEAICNNLLI